MMKKIMIGLLVAMIGVCFGDYKSEFNWNLTDSAKIEKGLAEATTAKDKAHISLYNILKSLLNKDATNTSYTEFKKLFHDKKPDYLCSLIVNCKRFNPFIKNVVNDPELNNCKYYNKYFPWINTVYSTLGFAEWKRAFINLKTLNKVSSLNDASRIFKLYKNGALSLNSTEIKTDCAVFKRAWYANITKSEEWKKLLVEIELMIKSVE